MCCLDTFYLVYAILVFLVPQLVALIMKIVAIGQTDQDTTSWVACWDNAYIVNK